MEMVEKEYAPPMVPDQASSDQNTKVGNSTDREGAKVSKPRKATIVVRMLRKIQRTVRKIYLGA